MTTYTRKNAWNNGGTFDNPDLYWYAQGVRALQARDLDNPNSWWFFAAIHGEILNFTDPPEIRWNTIPGPPNVPTSPVPEEDVQTRFWNQCQHQSWFFPPWHRGYLVALEAQVREAIISLGGPSDWALPYWNYLGRDDQFKMPPAFAQLTLKDGSPNPLYVQARYGINTDHIIYVNKDIVNQKCQVNTTYTGSDANTKAPGYGGHDTGFHHGGTYLSGNLEANPHNIVHTQVGGGTTNRAGLMSVPGTAGLDPIFYLHHCNIDRLWASWNYMGNKNPTEKTWLDGPVGDMQRKFFMPMPQGKTWEFTPKEVTSLDLLDYAYDDLTSIDVSDDLFSQRMNKLGIDISKLSDSLHMTFKGKSELIGTNDGPLELGRNGIKTAVNLERKVWKKINKSLLAVSENRVPDQLFLQIENVTGASDAHVLTVTVNGHTAGHVSLFGLFSASNVNGPHGGNGLTFLLEITDIIDDLHLNDAFDVRSLDVEIVADGNLDNKRVSVGRISVYREQ